MWWLLRTCWWFLLMTVTVVAVTTISTGVWAWVRPTPRNSLLTTGLGHRPASDLGGDRVSDLIEFGVFLEHRFNHRAYRNNPFAFIAGGIERFLDQDGRQASSAEFGIYHGVVEDALVSAVCE